MSEEEKEAIKILKDKDVLWNNPEKKVIANIDIILKLIEKLQKENEKQGKVIEKTLDYIEREEIDSIGTPFIYTFIGKKIKSLLKGEENE